MTVYVDVLLTVNLFVNYFLLLCTSIILKNNSARKRLILGGLAGSLYCLIIFIDNLPWQLVTSSKIVACALIVFISFGYGNFRKYMRSLAVFAGVNFAFAGIMYALWTSVSPTGMFYNNGIAYFDINLAVLAVSTVVSFIVVSLISFLIGKRAPDNCIYKVKIEYGGKEVILTGFADTGNTLNECFSGFPVVICEYNALKNIVPQSITSYFENSEISNEENFRIIMHKTVSGNGILPAFKPDRITVSSISKKYECENVYIGVSKDRISNGEYQIILNTQIFEKEIAYEIFNSENKTLVCKNQTVR